MESAAIHPAAAKAILSAGRHGIASRFSWNLRHQCVVAPGTGVVVALSGGPDSVGLLALCAAVAGRGGGVGGGGGGGESSGATSGAIHLAGAVHVHHHLRESADEDARVAREVAAVLGVRFVQCDVSVERNGNVLARAREARYAALAGSARALGASVILTAHHANDQWETQLLQSCRGDWPLVPGIAWRRVVAGPVAVARPLLDVRRDELRELVAATGLPWVEDPSNAAENRHRARMRAEVEPVLCAEWGAAPEHAAEAVHLSQEWASIARDHLLRCVGGGPEWDRRLAAQVSPTLLAWHLAHCCGVPQDHGVMRSLVRAVRDGEVAPRTWGEAAGASGVWTLDARALSWRPSAEWALSAASTPPA